jgi:serine/threonine protein kinase
MRTPNRLRAYSVDRPPVIRRIADRYDGQNIFVNGVAEYNLGDYLGGGAAGVVYDAQTCGGSDEDTVAIKVLNPIGFKLTPSNVLQRCAVAREGASLAAGAPVEAHHVWWVVHPSSREVIAAYIDPRRGQLKELTLPLCARLWGWDVDARRAVEQNPSSSSTGGGQLVEVRLRGALTTVRVPDVSPKFVNFVQRRRHIYREISNMNKLSGHENVLKLYEVLELVQDSKLTLFLAMELAAGGELFDRIEIDRGTEEETARRYFRQLLSGIEFCHTRGVAHRDLKPENLLLTDPLHDPLRDGDDAGAAASDGGDGEADAFPTLKIADFGLSALFRDDELDDAGSPNMPRRLKSVVGSPHYVAPEVLRDTGEGYDGAKADVWSAGVILYAMLAGNLPFGKELLQCPRFEKFKEWGIRLRKQRELEPPAVSHGGGRARRRTAPVEAKIDDEPRAAAGSRGSQPPAPVVYPSWFFPAHFSASIKDLLVSLLEPYAPQRISVRGAMRHEWMREGRSALAAAAIVAAGSTPVLSTAPTPPAAAQPSSLTIERLPSDLSLSGGLSSVVEEDVGVHLNARGSTRGRELDSKLDSKTMESSLGSGGGGERSSAAPAVPASNAGPIAVAAAAAVSGNGGAVQGHEPPPPHSGTVSASSSSPSRQFVGRSLLNSNEPTSSCMSPSLLAAVSSPLLSPAAPGAPAAAPLERSLFAGGGGGCSNTSSSGGGGTIGTMAELSLGSAHLASSDECADGGTRSETLSRSTSFQLDRASPSPSTKLPTSRPETPTGGEGVGGALGEALGRALGRALGGALGGTVGGASGDARAAARGATPARSAPTSTHSTPTRSSKTKSARKVRCSFLLFALSFVCSSILLFAHRGRRRSFSLHRSRRCRCRWRAGGRGKSTTFL